MRRWVWLGILWGCVLGGQAAPTLFTYRSAESSQDVRNQYDLGLLRLALEKTREQYGDYRLQASPPMNTNRAWQELEKGSFPNFIIKQSYSPEYESQGMLRGQHEVDLGIVGYRVCYTRESLLPTLAQHHSLADWQGYLYGQGAGWMDVPILQHNGFRVLAVAQYRNLFPMVAKGRFDLFCRGINEIRDEWAEASAQPGLVLEPDMMLYYDLPRFFYAHPRDEAALVRIETGLRLAAADGSWIALWRHHYLPSIHFVKPQHRQLFRMKNPFLAGLVWAPDQLEYDPLTDQFVLRQSGITVQGRGARPASAH